MFGQITRIVFAVCCLLFGVMLTLWAYGQGDVWKFAPAMFCFAIVGALVLPRWLSRWCGYAVAAVVLAFCLWIAVHEFDGGSLEYFAGIGRILVTFGIPAAIFIASGRPPVQFDNPLPDEYGNVDDPSRAEHENDAPR